MFNHIPAIISHNAPQLAFFAALIGFVVRVVVGRSHGPSKVTTYFLVVGVGVMLGVDSALPMLSYASMGLTLLCGGILGFVLTELLLKK